MATTDKAPVLVVLQLSGGNDYMNTVIPYNDPLYRDYRPRVGLPEEQILPVDGEVGLHPSMAPLHEMYNQGKLAIHPWGGLSELGALPFPLHGYLAHLRARQDGDRGLAGAGDAATRSAQR